MSARAATVNDRFTSEQIARFYEEGHWSSSNFYGHLLKQVALRPEKVFIFDDDTALTYAQFRESIIRVAVGLSRTGIHAGDRVAVQLPNWTEFAVVAGALSRLGAVLVPIMPIYRGEEVAYVLRHSGAFAAVTCGEFRGFNHASMFEGLRDSCPELRHVYLVRCPPASVGGNSQLLTSLYVEGELDLLEHEAGEGAGPDSSFMIVYTSGTTSRPKGCHHTFNTVYASARAIAEGLEYDDTHVQFGPSPITHSTGLVTSVVMPMIFGASTYVMPAWEPTAALERIARHRLTTTVTATPFLQMVMATYDAERDDASSLRIWVCAGSPIPGAVVQQASAMFPNSRTLSLYGRSENFTTTMCRLSDPDHRSVTSDGSALEGFDVVIVDEDGREVERGEEGDIAFRGPSHMLEYYDDAEQTEALFTPDGYSRSGDLGRMDSDGFVRVTGRLKDIIIRGGMNISSREVEELVADHSKVAAVAVVGYPDELLGERVCACVVLAEPFAELTVPELADYLRGKDVAIQKVPERIEIVESLPMTATGKIQKHLLRLLVASELS